ncbi:MAG: histidine kinase [Marinilabiliaceae bacterium]|nr:histidine kinase [Marinilabiliaceae bacterium]
MQNHELHFISRLPTYTATNTLIRIVLVGLVGTLFLILATNVTSEMELAIPFSIYVRVIITFIILSECNVIFDNIAERFFPIPERIKTRVFLHFVISLTIGFLSILYFDRINVMEDFLKQRIVWLLLAFGLLFVFILIMVSIGLRITEKWIRSLKEIDLLKDAKLKSDYSSLQDQLNPHFLFNNLSVLKSMIIYDAKAAVNFTQNFTDVYRYVLQSSEKTTVKLKEELEFIHSYIGVHKERLGESLEVHLDISPDMMNRELPSLALQLLVENALKHNIASKKKLLKINISAKNNQLTVLNNIQIKDVTYSTRKGLNNLVLRYEMLTEQEIKISSDNDIFKVTIPLL